MKSEKCLRHKNTQAHIPVVIRVMISSHVMSLLENSIVYTRRVIRAGDITILRKQFWRWESPSKVPGTPLWEPLARKHVTTFRDLHLSCHSPLPSRQGHTLGARAPALSEWVLGGCALLLLSALIYQVLLKRKVVGANTPSWALHSWRCRHILSPLPQGVAALFTWTFLSRREWARPALPGSPEQNLCGGLLHKYAWAVQGRNVENS